MQRRLLIPISLQFSIRYVLRSGLLDALRETFTPVVLLAWQDEAVAEEFRRAGCEVHALPKGRCGASYLRVRAQMTRLFREQLDSPSGKIIQARRSAQLTRMQAFKDQVYVQAARLAVRLPGVSGVAGRMEQAAAAREPYFAELSRLISALRGDCIFSLTPYQFEEGLLCKAGIRQGLPSIAAILSFDNITMRGWIPARFHRYLLWSEMNARQLVRGYPNVDRGDVRIVGSPQFDFYYRPDYIWPEAEWRQRLGIAAGRPVILFGGGLERLSPQEPGILKDLDTAITAGQVQGNPVVLLRRHPNDFESRWESVLRGSSNIIAMAAWDNGGTPGLCNVTRSDIECLASTLRHCAVHINTASTMAVDGAIVDRPQIGLAYDPTPEVERPVRSERLYELEHYEPIASSGGLAIVRSRPELIAAVNEGLANPELHREGRKRMVERICTYSDGRSAERVAAEVRQFFVSECSGDVRVR